MHAWLIERHYKKIKEAKRKKEEEKKTPSSPPPEKNVQRLVKIDWEQKLKCNFC